MHHKDEHEPMKLQTRGRNEPGDLKPAGSTERGKEKKTSKAYLEAKEVEEKPCCQSLAKGRDISELESGKAETCRETLKAGNEEGQVFAISGENVKKGQFNATSRLGRNSSEKAG